MRPLRFLLSLATCLAAVVLLLYIAATRAQSPEDTQDAGAVGTYFNWRMPSSLFPPSAMISLTDDNSTFFLARPAAFGPLLPSRSLSAPLWIGSGFGDDHLGRGGSAGGSEGELGCSDVPGWRWQDGDYRGVTGSDSEGKKSKTKKPSGAGEDDDTTQTTKDDHNAEAHEAGASPADPEQDDGTDDHLHHPLPPSDGLKTSGESSGNTKKAAHADIQSLQESAEIAGKIVLLSRGGCGFLEKAKWVQRRGGVALIVGDDIRGAALTTMYARGDTSNVTIPSVFTSHTTAHLLSSLIPSERFSDDVSAEEAARLGVALGGKVQAPRAKVKTTGRKDGKVEKAVFTTTTAASKSTSTSKSSRKDANRKSPLEPEVETDGGGDVHEVGWLKSVFGGGSTKERHEDSRRPPSSGNINWVLQEDFNEDEAEIPKGKTGGKIGKQASASEDKKGSTKEPGKSPGDGFVIGVQDWRDPDLMAVPEGQAKDQQRPSLPESHASTQQGKVTGHDSLKGGSITPGSGEYGGKDDPAVHMADADGRAAKQMSTPADQDDDDSDDAGNSAGWLHGMHWSGEGDSKSEDDHASDATSKESSQHRAKVQNHHDNNEDDSDEHIGLWITLTPTSMSSSPFFDTLLVLVVSPLVTLTVVYALLLLRSRIRRRRWRAPKSVVERLPVRTYQTMPSTTTSSSRTSSIATVASLPPTTPLLHPTAARPIGQPRSRPRSRTAPEVPVQQSSSLRSIETAEEKRAAGLEEWRRRYGGKQKECVVCLEEYVDGVSRVMSLPCGHEFHAECM